MEDIVVKGESCKLLISVSKRESWDRETLVSFLILNDNAVIFIKLSLENLLARLNATDNNPIDVLHGLMTNDYVLIEKAKTPKDEHVLLTVVRGGVQCLSGNFVLSSLKDAIFLLLQKNKKQ